MRVQAYMRTTQPAFNKILDVVLTHADNVLEMTNPFYGAYKLIKVTIPTETLTETLTESKTFEIDRTKAAGWSKVEITIPKDTLEKSVTEDVTFTAPSTIAGYDTVRITVPKTTKTITSNGTYECPSGYAGFSSVVVDVEPVLESITITENGTYTPTSSQGFDEVTVDVQGGKEPVITQLDVTVNGTYTVPAGTDGYNPVNVNVPVPTLESLNVVSNGTYTAETNKGWNNVVVNVSGGSIGIIEDLTFIAPKPLLTLIDTEAEETLTFTAPKPLLTLFYNKKQVYNEETGEWEDE